MKWYDYSNGHTLPIYFDDMPNTPEQISRTILKQSIAVDNWWGVFISLEMWLAINEKLSTGKELTWTEQVNKAAEYLWEMLQKEMIKVKLVNSLIVRFDPIKHAYPGMWEYINPFMTTSVTIDTIVYLKSSQATEMVQDIKSRWDTIMQRAKIQEEKNNIHGISFPYADPMDDPYKEANSFCMSQVLVSHPDDHFWDEPEKSEDNDMEAK